MADTTPATLRKAELNRLRKELLACLDERPFSAWPPALLRDVIEVFDDHRPLDRHRPPVPGQPVRLQLVGDTASRR